MIIIRGLLMVDIHYIAIVFLGFMIMIDIVISIMEIMNIKEINCEEMFI